MDASAPPPLPRNRNVAVLRGVKILAGFAVVTGVLVVGAAVLQITGLIRFFSSPTNGMLPAIASGDQIIVERLTFLVRKPQRGDPVVFKADNVPSLSPGDVYFKRLVGQAGDQLRLAEGRLYVNGSPVVLSNSNGESVT